MPSLLFGKIRAPFYENGRFCLSTTALFVLINLIVLINALIHDPSIGYDSQGHLNYITALSKGHLVTKEESYEFFSPPLPYFLPAVMMYMTSASVQEAAKLAQLFNVLLSIGTTFFLIQICHLVYSDTPLIKQITLASLGVLPVYYKTFAFVRGEPFVVFFVLLSIYFALQILGRLQITIKNSVFLGLGMGLAGLSRQWGFLLIPAVTFVAAIWVFKLKSQRRPLITSFIASLSLAFVVTGWFYLTLLWRYDSVTAFNRTPYEQFAFSNQRENFFGAPNLNILFTEPVRNNFTNQFWPIFYSEIWGDYWGYFVFYGKDLRTGEWLSGISLSDALSQEPQPEWLKTNRFTLAPYLGVANGLGLFPLCLAICALLYGGYTGIRQLLSATQADLEATTLALSFLLVAVSLAGYFGFLVMYPTENGDTVKATYMLHTFPVVALLTGSFLYLVVQKFPYLLSVCKLSGGVLFLYNLPLLISRFVSI